jgi:hypothetical protein
VLGTGHESHESTGTSTGRETKSHRIQNLDLAFCSRQNDLTTANKAKLFVCRVEIRTGADSNVTRERSGYIEINFPDGDAVSCDIV